MIFAVSDLSPLTYVAACILVHEWIAAGGHLLQGIGYNRRRHVVRRTLAKIQSHVLDCQLPKLNRSHKTHLNMSLMVLECTTCIRFRQRNKQVRQWGLTYIHTCRPTSTRRTIFQDRRISRLTFTVYLPTANFTSRWLADSSDLGFLGSKVPQNGRFPAQMPMNNCAKIDAASFILGGEIQLPKLNHSHKTHHNKSTTHVASN